MQTEPITVYALVIDTDTPDVYNGARLSLHRTREEALEDLKEWLEELAYNQEDQSTANRRRMVLNYLEKGDVEEAANYWASMENRRWRIDQREM